MLLITQLKTIVCWTQRSGKSTFYVNFELYDLEILVVGSKEFDLHTRYGGSDRGLIEFVLDSYSTSFPIAHMCNSDGQDPKGRISRVPVPASNQRIWRISKSSRYLYIYCDGVMVGQFYWRNYWGCLPYDVWNNVGNPLFFLSLIHI